MTRGFLLFAHNNEEIDYGKMSVWCAKRIKSWLSYPITLVTDNITIDCLDKNLPAWRSVFDSVIVKETTTSQTKRYEDKQLTFHNLDRTDSFDLSPYEETIVLDTDVLIQSSQLNKLWGNNSDLLVCKNSKDVYSRRFKEFEFVNETGIHFLWATIFYFRKSEYTRHFFNLCKKIKENYNLNKKIYGLNAGPVRNDFIWSISIHHFEHKDFIPWNLPFSIPKDKILVLEKDFVTLLTSQGVTKIKNRDIHLMNKFDLMEFVDKELQ